MAKNKKGVERKEYPKLIKVGDKKIRVTSKEEEDKFLKPKKEEKKTGWGE